MLHCNLRPIRYAPCRFKYGYRGSNGVALGFPICSRSFDPDYVRSLLNLDGNLREYASITIESENEEVKAWAVQQDGQALEFGSEEIGSDRKPDYMACGLDDGEALRHDSVDNSSRICI